LIFKELSKKDAVPAIHYRKELTQFIRETRQLHGLLKEIHEKAR
jgi:hypothetical protein